MSHKIHKAEAMKVERSVFQAVLEMNSIDPSNQADILQIREKKHLQMTFSYYCE